MTNVLILPHRPAVMAAKMLTTIDVLSKGRVIAGVGAGWLKEEFDALQSDTYHHRGAVLDEYLQAFQKLWVETKPEYDGKFVKFRDIVFAPKPFNGQIPIWIGGEGPAALRRLARYGTGWCPTSANPSNPLDTVERFRSALDELRRVCASVDRDPTTIDIALWPAVWDRNSAGSRKPFYGPSDQVIEDIETYQKAGLTHLTLQFQTLDRTETVENMQRFAEEIKPHIRS
jgi:probable F420-dependent oxidoreductase